MRSRDRAPLVALIVLALPCACRSPVKEPAAAPGPPVVYTTFYPTTYFAERIGGDLVRVVCPVPEGEDPIFWMPDAATVQAYQEADLILINGAEYEKWVGRVSLPPRKLVDTAAPLASRFIRFTSAVTHSHGAAGAHEHTGTDGHSWLDPLNAKVQAEQVCLGLTRLLPQHAATLQARLVALHGDLDQLHASLQEASKDHGGRPVLASHPAYNYLAARYGWNVVNLDLDPEQMPAPDVMQDIQKKLQAAPATHILWESAPLPAIQARFSDELHLTSVVLAPAELLSPAERQAGVDYLALMKQNVEALRAVFARAP